MKRPKAKDIALWGIMGALAIAVAAIESLFEIPFLPPGAKPGLSNVITVTSAVLSGLAGAFYITAIKALFALFTRGTTAFLLSLAGGALASTVTVLLLKMKRSPFSLTGISIIGALVHNAGQLAGAALLTGTAAVIYYAPALIIFSLVSGFVTGFILRAIMPYIKKEDKR